MEGEKTARNQKISDSQFDGGKMLLKEAVRKQLSTGRIDPSNLIEQVKDFQIVSFDIFDTLLKRNVEKPSDVFRIMEYGNAGLSGFAATRINAEAAARKKAHAEEIVLDEIYGELEECGFKRSAVSPADELWAEESVLTVNIPIKEVFDYCINAGKDVYLISDIYLPIEFVRRILEKWGYIGYKKLYVSSGCRLTKRTGTLYHLVLSENHIEPSKMVHLGDSVRSDFSVPMKMGIKAIHIPRYCIGRTVYKHSMQGINNAALAALINNEIGTEQDLYYHFGFECFGPFLWGFSRWLINSCQDKGIDRIYFFSRDGWIMKRAFDIVNKDPALKSYYLEVSRRSLRVPILWMDCEFESVINMLGSSKLISIRSIFDGIGLDVNNYGDLIKKYGFHKDTYFDRRRIQKDVRLRALYEELKPEISEVSRREYDGLTEYVRQNKLGGKFAVVDIGWSGSMQRYLVQALRNMGIACEVHGLYIGISDFYAQNTKIVPDLELDGYLFDFKNHPASYDNRSCFVGLFEMIFLERGGSVKNYEDRGGICHAVRYHYEYIVDSKPTPETLCVEKIQEAALEFISKISDVKVFDQFTYSSSELFSNIRKAGAHPGKRDLQMFAEFRFFDEGEILYLAKPRSLIYYLRHVGELKSDFLRSRWKTGFLKALFKLPLDYNRLYEFLRRYK